MVPHSLKMLTSFIVVVALINLTYYATYWTCPVQHPAMRKIGIYKRLVHFMDTNVRVEPEIEIPEVTKTKPLRAINKAMKMNGPSKYSSERNINNNLQKYKGYLNQSDDKEEERFMNVSLECPKIPPSLGPTNWSDVVIPVIMDKVFSSLDAGGSYHPYDCDPTESVAVIVPYRGVESPLLLFLFSVHIFLLKQMIEYQVFVVRETNDTVLFNPGKLSNIGFIEAHKLRKDINWTCVVFHNPYLAPVDSRNLYRCSKQPKQLVRLVDNHKYEHELGGVIAMRPKEFDTVNGFSNSYFDSASVYNDMYDRILAANLTIAEPCEYAKYNSLKTGREHTNPMNMPPSSSFGSASADTSIITTTMQLREDGVRGLRYSLSVREIKLYCTVLEVRTT